MDSLGIARGSDLVPPISIGKLPEVHFPDDYQNRHSKEIKEKVDSIDDIDIINGVAQEVTVDKFYTKIKHGLGNKIPSGVIVLQAPENCNIYYVSGDRTELTIYTEYSESTDVVLWVF